VTATKNEVGFQPPIVAGEISLWGAKAQIKELKTDKVQQISIDFVGQAPGYIRADITGPLGISLATLVTDQNQIQYILYRQKSFYEGQASEKALRSVLKMDLDARHLYSICFDQPILEKNWNCKVGKDGMVDLCKNEEKSLLIQWTERNEYKKRVILSNADYEIQIVYKDYRTKVLDPSQNKSPFRIEVPEEFKRYKVY